MVDPLSVTIGVGVAIVTILAGYGLYAAGQRPDHMIDMREVSAFYRHVSAAEALHEDVSHDEEDG